MFKGKDGLAGILLEEAEREEQERQRKLREAEKKERLRREAEEAKRIKEEEMRRAERFRRLMEERRLRERDEALREVQRTFDQKLEEAKQEKRKEYLEYYERYNKIMSNADEIRKRWLSSGWDSFKVEAFLKSFMEICMNSWPEPYRSKCCYTLEEKTAFLLDPVQSAMWISFLPP
ncbi:MAG: hypothetical protein V1850_02460 [Candidatus Bathyarchaeota archaeon]